MKQALTALVVSLLTLAPSVGLASHEPPPWPRHDRIYLMASSTDYRYWSVDPEDPELDLETITARCGAGNVQGIPEHSKPCLQGVPIPGQERLYGLFFMPGARFETAPVWSASSPLRFRFELDVDTLGMPYTVRLALQTGASVVESAPATEVASGVFEGTMNTGSPMSLDAVTMLGVRVRTSAEHATLSLRAGGSSWIQLPAPVGAKGVPRLLADSSYAPEPSQFTTPTRSFRFNDKDWTSATFSGELDAVRTFPVTLDRPATALIAWVEVFDTPFVHDAIRDRDPDPRHLTDGAAVRLLRDGELVDRSAAAAAGQGTAALAVTNVQPEGLTLEVNGSDNTDDPLPYTAHVVAVYGERTLRSMRWRFTPQLSSRLGPIGTCPGAYQPVPVTPEMTTFHVDLDWDTQALVLPGWTLTFAFPGVGGFPCSEFGNGDWVRFTAPAGSGVWWMGPTAARDRVVVSAHDTVFEMEARYAYTTPPPPEHLDG